MPFSNASSAYTTHSSISSQASNATCDTMAQTFDDVWSTGWSNQCIPINTCTAFETVTTTTEMTTKLTTKKTTKVITETTTEITTNGKVLWTPCEL